MSAQCAKLAHKWKRFCAGGNVGFRFGTLAWVLLYERVKETKT